MTAIFSNLQIISDTITTVECKTEPLPYTGESHLPHEAGGGAPGAAQGAGQVTMGGMGYDLGNLL